MPKKAKESTPIKHESATNFVQFQRQKAVLVALTSAGYAIVTGGKFPLMVQKC